MDLVTLLERELKPYAKASLNGDSILMTDAEKALYTIVAISQQNQQRVVTVNLIVQIMGDVVVIDVDRNSKPLHEALEHAGVPREKIVLAYAGETVPDAAIPEEA